jgi:hypothetical protein
MQASTSTTQDDEDVACRPMDFDLVANVLLIDVAV